MWKGQDAESPRYEGGTVTHVGFQARSGSERVNVYLDGGYSFSVAADIGLTLREGQQLDPDTIGELCNRDEAEKAYHHALKFLASRPRSISEVRRRLSQHGHELRAIDAVVVRLEEGGLVYDRQFAAYWVGQRQTFRPRGARALRGELRQKGLDRDVAEAAINSAAIGQDEAAYWAGWKRAGRLTGCDEQAFARAMTMYLTRRGFDYDVVRVVVQRLRAETSSPE